MKKNNIQKENTKSNKYKENIEIRLLSAVRKTLIAIAKDTMTKPGLKHPLSKNTQLMITDLFAIISKRQVEIEKERGVHSEMKPVFKDEKKVQSISVHSIKKLKD